MIVRGPYRYGCLLWLALIGLVILFAVVLSAIGGMDIAAIIALLCFAGLGRVCKSRHGVSSPIHGELDGGQVLVLRPKGERPYQEEAVEDHICWPTGAK